MYELNGTLTAPLTPDVSVGSVTATIGSQAVAAADLFSARTVAEGSLLQTTWDEVLLWFE